MRSSFEPGRTFVNHLHLQDEQSEAPVRLVAGYWRIHTGALAEFPFDFFEPLLVGGDEVAAEGVHQAQAAFPLSARISAWCTSRSIMAAATTSSPKISPYALNGLFEVTIIEARS